MKRVAGSKLGACWGAALLVSAGVAGCGVAYLPIVTSGAVGCPPEEIAVEEQTSVLGLRAWRATCRGHVFQCSNTGRDLACTEMLPPVSALPAGPAMAPVVSPVPVAPANPQL